MRVRFTEIPVGSCCTLGKNGEVKKKVGEHKTLYIKDNGKVSTRKVKGDPEVEPTNCPLRYLGAGLRKHPEVLIQIGDGNILECKKNRR